MPINLVGLTKVNTATPAWPPAWSTSGSKSAALSGWRSSAQWPGARWPTACDPRPPRPPRRPRPARARPAQAAALQAQIYHHALATGFSRGFLVSAGVLALIVIIALFMMRASRADLAGTDPAPVPPGDATSPNPA